MFDRFGNPTMAHQDSALRATRAMYRDLKKPLHWKEPQRIWFDDKHDVFDGSVPRDWIDRIWAVMALAPHHTFIIATSFPEAMRRYLTHPKTQVDVGLTAMQMVFDDYAANPKSTLGKGIMLRASDINPGGIDKWPLPNVWLGVHVKHQADADARIRPLLHTPAALRFVSCDPLIGQVNLDLGWNNDLARWDSQGRELPLRRIDWVIAGGETGRDARPMHPDWVRSLRDQCATAGVPFWFSQWGEWLAVSQGGPEWSDGLYRSRRRAGPDESQPALDEAYGRVCKVPTLCMHNDGEHAQPAAANAYLAGKSPVLTFRVGKRKAGRLLDGVEHNGEPEKG